MWTRVNSISRTRSSCSPVILTCAHLCSPVGLLLLDVDSNVGIASQYAKTVYILGPVLCTPPGMRHQKEFKIMKWSRRCIGSEDLRRRSRSRDDWAWAQTNNTMQCWNVVSFGSKKKHFSELHEWKQKFIGENISVWQIWQICHSVWSTIHIGVCLLFLFYSFLFGVLFSYFFFFPFSSYIHSS